MRLVHLSDLHFGTESREALDALGASLTTLAPDVLVVSGDLTQRARRQEFLAARQYLDAFDRPLVVVPGNHDIPLFNPLRRALHPFGHYRDAFGAPDTRCVSHGPIRLIALNSVRPERHASGRVGQRQRQEVSDLARKASPGQINIVIVHHPLELTKPDASPQHVDGSRDARTCRDWQAAGIHLVLSGHVHRPSLRASNTGESTPASGPWHLSAGTAISRRLRHEFPNTFNLIEIPDASATIGSVNVGIERWDHAPGAETFARHGRQVIAMTPISDTAT